MRQKDIVLIIAGLLILSGCGKTNAQTETAEENAETKTEVHFTKELQTSVGLTTVKLEKRKLVESIEVYGTIAQDTESTVHVTPDKPGVLKFFSVAVGDTVDERTPLCVMAGDGGDSHEISSPCHGVVIAIYAKPGDRIDNVSSILTIANPDLLKASFDIYEKDLSFVKLEQAVKVKTTAYPDKEFSGKLAFISPRIDETTRTVKIRVDVENKEHLLKFGMFVAGRVEKESENEAVIVPLESIQNLEDKEVVFVKIADDRFEARDVKTGQKSDSETEVLEGLSSGDEVVVKGAFTLKSELLKDTLGEED